MSKTKTLILTILSLSVISCSEDLLSSSGVLMRTLKKQSASETECPTTSLRLAILIIV